jgi:hypothetical protein
MDTSRHRVAPAWSRMQERDGLRSRAGGRSQFVQGERGQQRRACARSFANAGVVGLGVQRPTSLTGLVTSLAPAASAAPPSAWFSLAAGKRPENPPPRRSRAPAGRVSAGRRMSERQCRTFDERARRPGLSLASGGAWAGGAKCADVAGVDARWAPRCKGRDATLRALLSLRPVRGLLTRGPGDQGSALAQQRVTFVATRLVCASVVGDERLRCLPR